MDIIQSDNSELNLAYGFLQNTSENIFLTGKAGTGKTTFLHNLKKTCPKRMVVLAPTGVAAINAGGVTIHSFFQMPFGPWLPGNKAVTEGDFRKGVSARYHKFSREKLNIIRSLDLIVIDEISMVRADLLDGIDELLRKFRNCSRPFGGVQLLMIGDVMQLAPVVKDEEWEILKDHYQNPFFFSSRALEQSRYITIELKHIYRQSDQEFIDLLNKVRHGDKNPETIVKLNKRYSPGANSDTDNGIILTTHNYQAKRINDDKMSKLQGNLYTFTAKIENEFPEYAYPTDLELQLKIGAQVMFVKNDSMPEKRYFNGKIGKIVSIEKEIIYVKCAGDQDTISVGPEVWQNAKYGLNDATGEIVETVTGTFSQYPLKAAWAITIHKSQGLTFDKVIIDAGAAFAHGQVYVALSRCRSLDGLTLSSPVSSRILINDSSVSQFTDKLSVNTPGEAELQKATLSYQHSLLYELFDFSSIQYRVSNFMRLIEQNSLAVLPAHLETLNQLILQIRKDISDVATKFKLQIDALLQNESDIGLNRILDQRVIKAVSYFIDKITLHFDAFLNAANTVETDNKDISRSLENNLKRFEDERRIKTATLEACRDGFALKKYLEARSKASIEKPVQKIKPSFYEGYSDDSNPDLYNKLKIWRNEKALSLDLPEYMILPYKTLNEIAAIAPSSLKELKSIKGIGKKKLKEFGSEILEITCQYDKSQAPIEIDTNNITDIRKQSESKPNTRQLSFDLFKSGKSISEIAEERNLTVSTIENHLSHFIASGQLTIDQFVLPEKVSQISNYFYSSESRSLKLAKESLGDSVSYGELHMVLAHLRYNGEIQDLDKEEVTQ